ncbi:hypothetical protein ACTWQB_12140 [Piscibacillus sp. B03]|uniref:hypothetical protein n=1 Tax=Piscibacillus sp. B03 TaxID=3457430 RepID=UPI003FCDFE96
MNEVMPEGVIEWGTAILVTSSVPLLHATIIMPSNNTTPILMTSETGTEIILVTITALIGVYLLAAAAQGWFFKTFASWPVRGMLFVAALLLIYVNYTLDFVALVLVAIAVFIQWKKGKDTTQEQAA